MSRAKQLFRKAALSVLFLSGAHRLAGTSTATGAILMFHHVRPNTSGDFAPNAHLEVTPAFLELAVKRARHLGREIVDLDEALRRLRERDDRPIAVITFDDGYRDNFLVAYPILRRLAAPFTVYLATGLIDRASDLWWTVLERVVAKQEVIAVSMDGPIRYFASRTIGEKRSSFERILAWLVEIDEDRQREAVRELAWRYGIDPAVIVDEEMMTWDEVKTLAADPLVTIGAHTVGHYALAKLPLSRAAAEVRDGAKVLEAVLGRKPRHFAYPYGYPSAAGRREFDLLAELGFDTAVTTRPGVLGPGAAIQPTALPRVSMNGHFQSQHYLDVLLSGAPFLNPTALLRGRRSGTTAAVSAHTSSR